MWTPVGSEDPVLIMYAEPATPQLGGAHRGFVGVPLAGEVITVVELRPPWVGVLWRGSLAWIFHAKLTSAAKRIA
jgi:hypothetical protein